MPVSGIDETDCQRARIGDVEIGWVESGPSKATSADPATRPPLVLVHGFTGHHDDWIEVLPILGAHRRTIAMDLRGHGDSAGPSAPSGYSFDELVNDLRGLLDHLGIDRCDLLGHSFGGFVVLRFALAHPERLRSLVFMNTAPEVPAKLSRDAWLKASEIAEARGVAFLQELSERVGREQGDPMLAKWGERYWAHQRRRLCAMTPASYRGIGQTFFDSESMRSRLAEIETPSLVLVGEADEEFLPGAALFSAHLPNARSVLIPDAGHHPHQENRSAWLEAMEAFLQRSSEETAFD